MTPVETVILALALAIDSFAVGAAVGLRHREPMQIFRLSFHFGLFQALLPLIGAVAGAAMFLLVEAVSHWVVFILLLVVGGRMIREAFSKSDHPADRDLTRGWPLIVLSLSVSLDALAVGVSLGLQEQDYLVPIVVIGVASTLATLVGMSLGRRAGPAMGRWGGVLAGLVLIGIGFKALLERYS